VARPEWPILHWGGLARTQLINRMANWKAEAVTA
jgi:hypothetical protein